METRYSFKISASCRITGTAWALARVFGRLMELFQIDRLRLTRGVVLSPFPKV
jgi:hypothetical protein